VCLNTTLGNVPIDRGVKRHTVTHTLLDPPTRPIRGNFWKPIWVRKPLHTTKHNRKNHHKKINLPQPTQTDIIEPKRTTHDTNATC